MSSITVKTTKSDFEYFKNVCLDWQKKLLLDSWKIYFVHGTVDDEESRASIVRSHEAHQVTIYFCKDWVRANLEPKTKKSIRDCAVHEIMHLLLADLAELAKQRFVTDNELWSAEEALVQKLVKILT